MNALARRFASLAALVTALLSASAFAQAPEGKTYTPGSFNRIEIDGSALIRLTQGERDQVFVPGDAEVQRSVEIELGNNRLRITPAGGWKFWNKQRLQIEVQVRQLSRITISGTSDLSAPGPIRSADLQVDISGAGQIRFDDLHAGTLRFNISGAGDGQLAGQAGDVRLNVSGKGKLQAEQLRAKSATVSISGVGSSSLWVTDALSVSISGVGNVEYWGQPGTVRRSTSGMGSIEARGDKR